MTTPPPQEGERWTIYICTNCGAAWMPFGPIGVSVCQAGCNANHRPVPIEVVPASALTTARKERDEAEIEIHDLRMDFEAMGRAHESIVDGLTKRAETAESALASTREALGRIRNQEGKVCENYEICEHEACRSSYTAWAIADAALDSSTKKGSE